VTTLSIRRSIARKSTCILVRGRERDSLCGAAERRTWRFFLLGAASLENATRYVRKAYVPLQLLISRVACPAEQQARLVPPLPGAFFLNGGKLLEEVAYVTNAYVPLQLLYCKRVEKETLCRHQQRDSPAWRLLFSGWKAYTGIEDGIIRNE